MILNYSRPVFKEGYKFGLKIFEYTKDFPREYKYEVK